MFTTTVLAFALVSAQDCRNTTAASAHAAGQQQQKKDLVDTAIAAGSFGTLVQAVQAAGLVETLKGEGPFTVFAPTDEAFRAVPEAALAGLLQDKEALTSVLTYHVVPGRWMAADVIAQNWWETAQGQSLRLETGEGGARIDGAKIIKTDIECSNGVIHVIDAVVMPRKDIVDTAVAAGSFTKLVAAVKAAELVDTLKSKGPFTVFAPADSAFAALPADELNALLADRKALTNVLTFHVVPGRILSTDLPTSKEGVLADSVQGSGLRVLRDSKTGAVTVDGARVVKADIICGNGVVHVIDRVLLPGASTH